MWDITIIQCLELTKMEAKVFKIDNYIHVPGFAVVDLQLSGNELLCYSLIYGFTQDQETEFRGSLAYVASALNVTKQNAKKIIERLMDRGLLTKKEIYFSGIKLCHYVANRNSNGVAETATGCCRNSNGGVAESATHIDKYNNITKDRIRNTADGGLFPVEEFENGNTFNAPTTERKESCAIEKRGTAENLCLFANSRFNRFEDFAACFIGPEFRNVDIAYYHAAVADWSAQKGKKMKDWIATARNFMRGDMEKNKLHTIHTADDLDLEGAKKYLEMCRQ